MTELVVFLVLRDLCHDAGVYSECFRYADPRTFSKERCPKPRTGNNNNTTTKGHLASSHQPGRRQDVEEKKDEEGGESPPLLKNHQFRVRPINSRSRKLLPTLLGMELSLTLQITDIGYDPS